MSPQWSDAFHNAHWSPDPLILQRIGHALLYFPIHSGFLSNGNQHAPSSSSHTAFHQQALKTKQ